MSSYRVACRIQINILDWINSVLFFYIHIYFYRYGAVKKFISCLIKLIGCSLKNQFHTPDFIIFYTTSYTCIYILIYLFMHTCICKFVSNYIVLIIYIWTFHIRILRAFRSELKRILSIATKNNLTVICLIEGIF